MLFCDAPIAGAAFAGIGDVVVNTTVSISGVQSTVSVGDVSAIAPALVVETGLAGTTGLGSVVVTADSNFAITAGLEATGISENAEDVIAKAVVAPSGLEATGSEGTLALETNNYIDLSGNVLTTFLANVEVVAKAVTEVTGFESSMFPNIRQVIAEANVLPSGVSATLTLDDEVVEADAVVVETGLVGTTALGTQSLVTNNYIDVTGVSATAVLDDEEVIAAAVVVETGVFATAYLGNESQEGDAVVLPLGVSCTGLVVRPTLWGNLAPTYTDIWTEIAA